MTFARFFIASATAGLLACSLAHAAPAVAPGPVAAPADAPKPVAVSAVSTFTAVTRITAPARARAASAPAANTVEALLARVGNTSEGW